MFELLLPAGMRVLSGELAEIDAVLDDPRFFGPFRPFFSPLAGRPSIPMETYLRMMVLKQRTGLGYARLCVEIADSLSWRRFCRIGLERPVPDESTIRKITSRCGPELIEHLNRELLGKANDVRLVNLHRVRVDTTVVEADIKFPTDSGLLTAAISRIEVRLRRLRARRVPVTFTCRTAEARSLQHSIGVFLRRRNDEAKAEVLVITGKLADLAERTVNEAAVLVGYNSRRRPVRRMVEALTVLVERTRTVIDQARSRVAGTQPDGATRLVSLHEPDARPIRKGRLGRPVEFGYKAQVLDNADGLILDHSVHIGNPSDTTLVRPALQRVIDQFGRAPDLLTADRGYWESIIEPDLKDLGVTTVVIPRTGKPSQARQTIEQAQPFVDAVKWRTGSEGRISHLKRDWAWRRTRLRSHNGARTWCAHGVFAHNIVKIVQLQT
ncbi:MAG: ISNCY family transposase [Acidimicrobiales bacterium]